MKLNNVGQMIICLVLFEEYGIKEFVRAPKLGEHTEETLKEIGYSDEQIKELKDKKII